MHLSKGQLYRATINLGFFESMASNATISERLESAGFAHVVVSGSGHLRTATGEWTLDDLDVAHLPSQVTHVELLGPVNPG